MAHIITLALFVDSDDEAQASIIAENSLETAKQKFGAYIVDSEIGTSAANASLCDSLVNETYKSGDAFSNWMIYSPSEAKASNGAAGYWSEEYDWTSFDLATRFSADAEVLPESAEDDVVFVLERLTPEFISQQGHTAP